MRAKKSLGQNFLKSNSVLEKIIQAGEISEDDLVLEIGPGKGALTEKILEKTRSAIAVEKDKVALKWENWQVAFKVAKS
jgi:16S rRNA (adenine1518-N6/adenine1519-N6)-dimethyltransferase